MKRFSRRLGAARLGLAALALGVQLSAPLASTTSAQSADSGQSARAVLPPMTTPPAPTPANTDIAITRDNPPGIGTPLAPRPRPCPDPGPEDYPVAAGWFFTQEAHGCVTGSGPARRRGYLVLDDSNGAFWTEFRR